VIFCVFVSSCWVWLEQACTWYTYAHCYSLGCKLRWSPLQPSHFGSGILASVARLWAFQSLSRPSCSRGGCSTKNESSQMYQRQRLQSVFLLLIQTETVCAVPARISLVNPRMIAVCVCMCVCVCVAGGLNTSVIEYALHTHQTYNIHLVRAVCTMPIAVFAILIKLSPFEVSNATACNSMLACAAKKLYLSALTTLVCLAEAARHLIHRTHHVLCAHVLRTTVA
jgi:hypothetical protein